MNRSTRRFAGTLLAALATLVARAPLGADAPYVSPWRTAWAYSGPRGPEHWGELDPDYALCGTGRQQSPIDIRTAQKADLPPLRFEYHAAPLAFVTNNGATIRVDYPDPPGSGDFLLVGGKRYQLQQFHFHRPSEEYLHGRPYDMVVHLMHRAADGELAGVAVLVRAGHANASVQQLFEHMPAREGLQAVTGVQLDPSALLPAQRGYYLYTGSQTAPPCKEGLKWFVLKGVLELGAGQIQAFATLYPHDARPLQPLNGRQVQQSR